MKTQYIIRNKEGTFYYKNRAMNIFHREDGPAIEYPDGSKEWWLDGKLHREESSCGDKAWVINGKLHREDGPAYEHSDGTKEWWFNDKWHREDGPAIEYPDGSKEWWLNGREVTEAEHKRLTTKEPTITIEGISFTVDQLKELINQVK